MTDKLIHLLILLAVLVSCEEKQEDPYYSIIHHDATGLTWMRCPIDNSGDGDDTYLCTKTHAELEWSQAIDACENMEFAGHSDWRLPNIRELQSIVDYCHSKNQSAIDSKNFPGTAGSCYWSSTTYPGKDGDTTYAWIVDFLSGNPWFSVKKGFLMQKNYTRCVRGPDK